MRHKKIPLFLFSCFFLFQPVSMQAMDYLRTARSYARHAALVGTVFALEYWQQAAAATTTNQDSGCHSYSYTDCVRPITAYKDSAGNFVINSFSRNQCEWVCHDAPASCFSGDDTVEVIYIENQKPFLCQNFKSDIKFELAYDQTAAYGMKTSPIFFTEI